MNTLIPFRTYVKAAPQHVDTGDRPRIGDYRVQAPPAARMKVDPNLNVPLSDAMAADQNMMAEQDPLAWDEAHETTF
jgi:hypothetical protein